MENVRRIYVEKKEPFAVKARELGEEIESFLGIQAEGVRVLVRYDVENVSQEVFEQACRTVFSEPPVDDIYYETIFRRMPECFPWNFCRGSLTRERILRCSACSS